MLTPLEESRGERLAQAVEGEPLMSELGVLKQGLELPGVEVVVIRRTANPVGEHEIIVVPFGGG